MLSRKGSGEKLILSISHSHDMDIILGSILPVIIIIGHNFSRTNFFTDKIIRAHDRPKIVGNLLISVLLFF